MRSNMEGKYNTTNIEHGRVVKKKKEERKETSQYFCLPEETEDRDVWFFPRFVIF
jgi:hypothetical protein